MLNKTKTTLLLTHLYSYSRLTKEQPISKSFAMKFLLLTCLLLSFSSLLNATNQIRESLEIKGIRLAIEQTPLDSRKDILSEVNDNRLTDEEVCIRTDCFRGYVGEWVVLRDSLFLEKITTSCGIGGNENLLTEFFPKDEIVNNRVFASWVTQVLVQDGSLFFTKGCYKVTVLNGMVMDFENCDPKMEEPSPSKTINPILKKGIAKCGTDLPKNNLPHERFIYCLVLGVLFVPVVKKWMI